MSKPLAVPNPSFRSSSLYRQLLSKLHRRSNRQHLIRIAFLATNVIVLGGIVFFVSQTHTDSQTIASLTPSSTTTVDTNPLDQVSSADIALTVARLANLPEATAATNQAQSEAADITIAASSDNVITKPQVVTTALKSVADIQDYVTQPGDTVPNLAARFGVTSDSIMWSNNLNSPLLNPGIKLLIPPVNGIIYTVQPGDTPASLATKFQANQADIIAFNDAEISGLTAGERIVIPNGVMSSGASISSSSYSSFPWGSAPIYGYNGYDPGFCTWFVASKIPVPSNWGNAATWAYYAALSGWNVSTVPTAGSIAQTAAAAGGEGHVAIVDAVNGAQVEITEMNGPAGFDHVDTRWVTLGTFQHYITR